MKKDTSRRGPRGTYPNSHLDNNPQAALCKYAVIVGPKAVVKELPATIAWLLVGTKSRIGRIRVRECTHASSYELAIGQNDFKTAVHHPMVYDYQHP
jgi:hypothetical protein